MQKFETADIVLAAFLKTQRYLLSDIRITGVQGTFVFDNVDNEILKKYDYGTATVEPKQFNREIKGLTTASRRNLNRGKP